MKTHLPPGVYGLLQRLVHDDHWRSFGLFTRTLDLRPGETVVEIGCGIGSLARHFAEQGFDYWGIDSDPARIELARQRTPGGQYLAWNAMDLENAGLPSFRRAFIHGVLHHLNDDECRDLIHYILNMRPDMTLSIIEPFRPNPWWINPLGTLFARLDEGQHIRTLEHWRTLFRPNAVVFEQISLWPRWPVGMLVSRLIPTPAR
jgi:SAM-dependent methyltransferase